MASTLRTKLILVELVKRRALRKLVSTIVDRDFVITKGAYTRRMDVHVPIANFLGIKQNNLFAKELMTYLKRKGAVPITMRGKRYYKNVMAKSKIIQNDEIKR